MLFHIPTQYENEVITVPVWTLTPERIFICVSHESKPNTKYFCTDPIISGKQIFTIKIPKAPSGVILEVYNEKNGNTDFDHTFKLGQIKVDRLVPNVTAMGFMNNNARDFACFMDSFCEDAGVLPSQNRVYESMDGKFRIDYKYIIRDDNGEEMRTPARVHGATKIIEVAKKYFQDYTVPGRKAIIWHEFSHVFRNDDPSNELEADKNAIFMYLATGNPRIEAFNVFLRVFRNTPSDLNVQRANELDNYIRNFDSMMNQLPIYQKAS